MKKISVFICVHLWTIFLCLSINAQDFKTVQDGIEYAEIKREIDKSPVKINLLRLDLTKVRLDVVHGLDTAIGVEKTSSMATRYGAFAAINAGFFRLDNSIFAGDSAGVLAINNELYSESFNGRTALMIDNNLERTEVSIERANITDVIEIAGKTFEAGRNRERKENDLVLFSSSFNYTTLTDNNGIEFFIKDSRIVKIVDQRGSNKIPQNGYILSASGKMREELMSLMTFKNKLWIGTKINHFVRQTSPNGSKIFKTAEDIVGGVPQLIKNGKIEITWEAEKASKSFVETRHPRTAVAKLKDGKFLMATVDGRSLESVGMNLQELAEFLLEIGSVEAMNLDGGGSTTMFLDGKIVNKPSDKEGERRVSDAILVFPRKKN
jgi:exopolysaccharide biosynthesis protein